MSEGHFQYQQYRIGDIADEIEQLIIDNDSSELNGWGECKGSHYSDKTMVEFNNAVHFLRLAQIYAQHVDWLISGDDGEDSFHSRLQRETQEHYKRLEDEILDDSISRGA